MVLSVSPALFSVLFPVLGVLFFVGLWTAICALLSTTSGWRAMARRYPCPEGLTGARLRSGFAARVGWVNYRGVLSFEATSRGLVARVNRLFPFHPALLLPWGALALRRDDGIFFAGALTVADGATFGLNREALDAIEHALSRSLPAAP